MNLTKGMLLNQQQVKGIYNSGENALARLYLQVTKGLPPCLAPVCFDIGKRDCFCKWLDKHLS